MVQPALDLHGVRFDKAKAIVGALLAKSQARYAMIIDVNGFVLHHDRALWAPEPPNLDSLASLVASNHSAMTAIAQLFGEDRFRETVHQGDEVGTYTEEIGATALLLTVFDRRSKLGRVKLFTQRAADALRRVVAASDEPAPQMEFDTGWGRDSNDLLDGLFGPEPA